MKFLRMIICGSLVGSTPALAALPVTSDATIQLIKDAIARSDQAQLQAIVGSVDYVAGEHGEVITDARALNMLQGCSYKSQTTNAYGITTLSYECPTRNEKVSCTTGNLKVMAYDQGLTTEIGLAEERTFEAGCPLPLAPPPVRQN